MKFKMFLNTMFASYLKVFVAAILLQLMNSLTEGQTLFSFDWEMWQKIINAGIVATIPVIMNALNPQDPRYGVKKDVEIVDKNGN